MLIVIVNIKHYPNPGEAKPIMPIASFGDSDIAIWEPGSRNARELFARY